MFLPRSWSSVRVVCRPACATIRHLTLRPTLRLPLCATTPSIQPTNRAIHTRVLTRHAASSTSRSSGGVDLTSQFSQLWSDVGVGGSSAMVDQDQTRGEVIGCNMGICTIDGIRTAHVGACVEFFDDEQPDSPVAIGLVLSIHADFSRALILGSSEEVVQVGQHARHIKGYVPTLDVSKVPSWQGQVIDPLGRILDPHTLTPIVARPPPPLLLLDEPNDIDSTHSKEPAALPLLTYPPPPLATRATAHKFLPTGFVHIDAFHPIADGLRVGLMGCKRTGKTALTAAILGSFSQQQKKAFEASEKDDASTADDKSLPLPSSFIYVSVGQSKADVRALIDRLQRNGSLAQTTVVVATQDSGMGLQYIAPFFGQTLADYHRDHLAEDSLIVFDDLSAHGQVLSTINRVFGSNILAPNFVHAQLLERTAPLTHNASSNTALVLVETGRNDRAVEVNENLSGFVDHAIWLDPNLASKGVFPSINVSSVLGRPSARYRPHIFRALSNSLSRDVLQSERRANMAKWAGEFGLEAEEEDLPILELKDKVQVLLSQRLDVPPYTLAEQMILLRVVVKDEGKFFARVSPENVQAFQKELVRTLRDPSIDEHVKLMSKLDADVTANVRTYGNATQGPAAEEDQRLQHAVEGGDHSSASTTSTTPTIWTSIDDLLERFIDDFVRKYER